MLKIVSSAVPALLVLGAPSFAQTNLPAPLESFVSDEWVTYQQAAPQGYTVLRLPSSLDAQLQSYFRELVWSKIILPDEVLAAMPKIVLVSSEERSALTQVNRQLPGVIFWHAGFLLGSPSADIDRYVAAHALHGLMPLAQWSSSRGRAFEADLSVGQRLFRFRLRDADRKTEPAVIHVPSFLHWLRESRGYNENYLDRNALSTATVLAFGRERMTRAFPSRATERTGLLEVSQWVRAELRRNSSARFWKRVREFKLPVRHRKSEFSKATGFRGFGFDRVKLKAQRMRGDLVAALARMEALRVEYTDQPEAAPSSALAHEFLYTFGALKKLVTLSPTGSTVSKVFAEFSKLPPDLFEVWEPLTTPVYKRLGWGSVPDPQSLKNNLEWRGSFRDEWAADSLIGPRIDTLTDERIIFAGSRAMVEFLSSPDLQNLTNRPRATLTYLAIAGATERLFASHRVAVPRVVTRFRAALMASLTRAFAPENLASALIDYVEQQKETLKDYVAGRSGYAIGQAHLLETYPEFAEALLARLPDHPIYARWRFELGRATDVMRYLENASRENPPDFVSMLATIMNDEGIVATTEKLHEIWYEFLESARGKPYVPGLDEIFRSYGRGFDRFYKLRVDDNEKLVRTRNTTWDAVDYRVSRALTARLRRDWRTFMQAWRMDGINPTSPLLTLIEWREVFRNFDAEDLARFFADYPDAITGDEPGWYKLREAVLERLLEFSADISNPTAIRVATAGLNLLSASSATGQKILKNLLAHMALDDSRAGALAQLDFLRSVRIINFARLEDFTKLYVDTLVRVAGGDQEFVRRPLEQVRIELTDIKHRFEPQTAHQILSRLAERYRADISLRSEFELNVDQNSLVGQNQIELWSDLISSIAPTAARDLIATLRLDQPLPIDSRRALRIIFARHGLAVADDAVAERVRSVFAAIGPVRQMSFLSDPAGEILRNEPGEVSPAESYLAHALAIATDDAARERILEGWLSHQAKYPRSEIEHRTHSRLMRLKAARRGEGAAEDAQILYELAKNLKPEQTLAFIETLRSGEPLEPGLRMELQLNLSKHQILVQSSAVEDYISQRFRDLMPYERAGVLKMILDASNNLLDQRSFRKKIFRSLLASLPDRETRDTFIDLWGAGMRALPKTLRSLVLAIVLAESGKVGSPETALVTLLSSLSSLEQKFGQILAFANIPESYRQKLRDLWDGAQKLDWFGAWDLLLAQHGDIRRAGFRLERVLNSGSTVAYLKIIHDDGRAFALAVYRDGIEHGVNVGRDQLRIFARELARRSPKRYGFLPLLVEDAVRTMEAELDPANKEAMTREMASHYREAAGRLGWRVEENHSVDPDGWSYRHLDYHSIDLGGGEIVRVQDLADGLGLGRLAKAHPELYRQLTAKLLELENAVIGGQGPVDKDRMPGQFMVNVDTRTVYILDHGQAAHLEPKIREQVIPFAKLGFAADVDGMARMTEGLTGMKPRGFDVGNRVRSADVSVRPFVYLNEVSDDYLKLDRKDPRARKFYELLHGVRAQLRLYQWEISEGHSRFTDAVRDEVLASTDHRKLALRTALGWIVRETSELWRKIKSWILPPTWRMEFAYRRASLFDCQEELVKEPG